MIDPVELIAWVVAAGSAAVIVWIYAQIFAGVLA